MKLLETLVYRFSFHLDKIPISLALDTVSWRMRVVASPYVYVNFLIVFMEPVISHLLLLFILVVFHFNLQSRFCFAVILSRVTSLGQGTGSKAGGLSSKLVKPLYHNFRQDPHLPSQQHHLYNGNSSWWPRAI